MFKNTTAPVIVCEAELFDDMQMTGPISGNDFGLSAMNQTTLTILDSNHPLSHGLTGVVAVCTTSGVFRWGAPTASASSVAALSGDPGKIVIFGYEKNDLMFGGMAAPGQRVGYYLGDAMSAASMSPQGMTLFDAAVSWSTSQTVPVGLSSFSVE